MEIPDSETKKQLEILINATTDLVAKTNIRKTDIDEKINATESFKDSVVNIKNDIKVIQTQINTLYNDTKKALSDTASKVYNNKASNVSKADRSPIANSDGHIDYKWFNPVNIPPPDFSLPLIKDLYVERGKAIPVQMDVSQAQDGSVMVDVPNLYTVNFTRGSEATYMDRGVVKKAKVNEPRFETDINGNPLGILIEGESTNRFTKSDCSTLVPIFGANITESDELSILGIKGRYLESGENGSAAEGRLPLLKGKIITASLFVKGNVGDTINIQLELTGDRIEPTFTLSGGLDRFEVTSTKPMESGINVIRIGRTNKNFHFIGLQVEEKLFATSYIPTNGSAMNRVGDVLTVDKSFFSSQNMTIVVNWDWMGKQEQYQHILFGDAKYLEWTLNNGKKIWIVFSKGSALSKTIEINEENNFIQTITDVNNALFVNGVKVDSGEITNHNVPVSKIFYLGSRGSVGHLHGHIKDFKIWNRALTDEQIYHLGSNQ